MRQQILKTAFWNLFRLLGRQGGYSLILLTAAFFLVPEDIGQAAIALGMAYLVRLPVLRGFRTFLLSEEQTSFGQYATLIWSNILLGIGLWTVLMVIAPVFSAYFNKEELRYLCWLASPIPLLTGFVSVQEGKLEKAFRQKDLARFQIEASVLGTLATLPFLLTMPTAALLIAFCLIEEAYFAIRVLLCAGAPLRSGFLPSYALRALRFAFPVMANALLSGGHVRLVQLLVGLLFGLQAAGIYRVASQLFQFVVQICLAPLSEAVFPVYAANRARTALLYRHMTGLVSALAYPLFFGISAIAALTITEWADPEWMPLAPVVAAFAFMCPTRILASVSGPMLTLDGRAKAVFLAELSVLVLSALLLTVAAQTLNFPMALAVYAVFSGLPWWVLVGLIASRSDLPMADILKLHGVGGGPALAFYCTGLMFMAAHGTKPVPAGLLLCLVVGCMLACWSFSYAVLGRPGRWPKNIRKMRGALSVNR